MVTGLLYQLGLHYRGRGQGGGLRFLATRRPTKQSGWGRKWVRIPPKNGNFQKSGPRPLGRVKRLCSGVG